MVDSEKQTDNSKQITEISAVPNPGLVEFSQPILSKNRELLPLYQNSRLYSMLKAQKKSEGESAAIFTDIDDTAFLLSEPETTKILFDEAEQQNCPVIADTGNQIQVVERRIAEGELPYFQAICSSVGSQIWVLKQDGENLSYIPDLKYRKKVLATGFDRKEVVKSAWQEIVSKTASGQELKLQFQWPEDEQAFLNGEPYLENQEFKVSLQFEGDLFIAKNLKEQFAGIFPKFRVSVCQIKPLEGERALYYLDILAFDKADAIDYLVEELDIDSGIVAGDSGNDISMLSKSSDKIHSVLVGYPKPEALLAMEVIISQEGVAGRGSFRRVPTATGTKLFYIERNGRKGPHSVKRAVELLIRARAISRIKKNLALANNG